MPIIELKTSAVQDYFSEYAVTEHTYTMEGQIRHPTTGDFLAVIRERSKLDAGVNNLVAFSANTAASRRSVLTRSPVGRGIRLGAMTSQICPASTICR